MVEKLLILGANPNIGEKSANNIPISYVMVYNENIELIKILLKYGTNINHINNLGQSLVHICINNDNYTICNIILKSFDSYNISNYNGETPLHFLLIFSEHYDKYNIKLMIENTDLNIQDKYGNTIIHYMIKRGILFKYSDDLSRKEINIFIKNKDNQTPFDMIYTADKSTFNLFIDIVAKGYLYTLQYGKDISFENNEINNKCKSILEEIIISDGLNLNNSNNKCINDIKNLILSKNISSPRKNILFDIKLDIIKSDYTTFLGISIDILSGLILLERLGNCTIQRDNIIMNKFIKFNDVFKNFNIIWTGYEIFFPSILKDIIVNYNKEYVIIPITITLSHVHVSHSNILIININEKYAERFEPNGSKIMTNFNYNNDLLDELIYNELKKYNITSYFAPKDYQQFYGFQSKESLELDYILGDPGGFCAAWSLWWAYMRLSYHNINNKKLLSQLERYFDQNNISYKSVIRSFVQKIVNIRDDILRNIDMDINYWLNNISEANGEKFAAVYKAYK